jgi:protein-tyrosine phosphatase
MCVQIFFLDAAWEAGETVVVHCREGRNRSGVYWCVYVYVYVYVYVNMYVYIYVYMCMYLYMRVYVGVYVKSIAPWYNLYKS